MYLLLSLVSLAGALYVIHTMMEDEEEAAGAETADVTISTIDEFELDMRPPRPEGMGELIAAATAGLRGLWPGWLGRQDSNLELSD